MDKAYAEFDIHDVNEPVVVAVIDSGVDIYHKNLQDKIWINEGEILDNHVDDNNNGYVDDVYGWNYIGGRNGDHVDGDTLEVTREYVRYTKMIQNGEELAYYEKVKADYKEGRNNARKNYREHSRKKFRADI